MPRHALPVGLLLVLTIATAGCGGEDAGTAPVISDLTYAPASGPVGTPTTITGQFSFTDTEGDVDSVTISVTGPGGLADAVGPQPVQGAAGQTAGIAGLALMLSPPAAGTYTFEVWLTDSAGHDSNSLTGTYEAQ